MPARGKYLNPSRNPAPPLAAPAASLRHSAFALLLRQDGYAGIGGASSAGCLKSTFWRVYDVKRVSPIPLGQAALEEQPAAWAGRILLKQTLRFPAPPRPLCAPHPSVSSIVCEAGLDGKKIQTLSPGETPPPIFDELRHRKEQKKNQ
ncbi:hypothetical protein SKAU_G00055030 [Synaphobranchus kaupii]|uniref:Uncharacterized protein n=1 Tax=Synaphobranchus kaupii TaxID=118154 RepID=A0A9Q1G4M5_SYNKA|nr:hypothetical protein SKAU_G00055030 [Synaphobranchus kaupii]